MDVRELRTVGAYLFVPRPSCDARGQVAAPYDEAAFEAATGSPLFPVRQATHSRSRRGAVRGVHFTRVPPGTATYAHCSRGRALYIAVDVRVGSPTYGRWESLVLDADHPSGVYLPAGVAHAVVALEETVITDLRSARYAARDEEAVSVLDPDLGLPVPGGADLIISERDRRAVTMAEAERRGILPGYDAASAAERSLRAAARGAGPRSTGYGPLPSRDVKGKQEMSQEQEQRQEQEQVGERGKWRIEVDRLVCAGTGLCLGTAHGRMRLDGGRARPVDEVVGPDDAVLDAAETCPMEAITVRDAATGEVLAPLR
ncbi:dTDP-4-dehydrorhamnose 3,5-epimerase family protein [Streptomyces sp. DH12]|uniref:dTDP-4-dehydrorhamnose 3,5-epimerase family protein n=1 Tax=Streptomyces sp. DH12 TaxID=2857010 RepID=UPI001E561579|nr:dTDP-4-dehydrorhamnose 3,5-epimerase family protein [Streptomyces sp. DH12]